MADRKALILLDNARDAAQVRPLLPGGGACRVLVTSRARLADLAGSVPLDLGVLDEADGLALLTRIVGPQRIAAELRATADILEVCSGLPLAIRIAGTRLAARPGWSVRSFADRLADHRRRLDELTVGDLGVRATLEMSYEDIGMRRTRAGVPLMRSFRMLALAPGSETSVPAAAALLDLPFQAAEEALEALVDASLQQTPQPGRYRIHDLLRACAAERAEAEDSAAERDAARERLLNWYLHTAANAAYAMNPRRRHPPLDRTTHVGQPLEFSAYDHALAWLDLEHANLVAAAAQAVDLGRHEIAWKLPIVLFDLFQLRGHHAEAVSTHRAGIVAARALGDQDAEGWLLSHLSVAYSNARRPDESIACLRRALEIDRDTGNRRSEAVNLVNLGFAYFVQRDFSQAVVTLQEAAVVAAETGHRVAEAAALVNIGEAYKELGQYEQALDYTHRSLTAHRALGDRQAEGSTLAALADIECLRRNPRKAVVLGLLALQINRETGFRREEAGTLHSLGRALAMLGQTAEALDRLAAAYAVYLELGDLRADHVRTVIDALS
jgi:tetratricopeptide (TPR) repeat protein